MNHANFAQTTLAAAITDTTGTSITVSSSATFPAAPFIASIDTEAMLVTVVAGTTWTVTRGYEGSTAATHLNGATIYHDISAAEADSIAAKKTDNVSATDKLLGRVTAGAGAIEEIACTAAGRAILDDANAAAQLATLGTAAYSEGTWTPVLVNFSIVGAAPALTGTYKKIGNLIYVYCIIAAGAGGNTSVACTGGNISGIPANGGVATGNILSPSSGLAALATITASAIYPQNFGAQTAEFYAVSVYFVA